MGMDRKTRRLFVGCGNKKLVVLNADSGAVVANLPIGQGVDAGEYDQELQLSFSSNGDGTLTVIHQDGPDKFSVVQNVETPRGARTLALDPIAHKLYLPAAEFGPAAAGAKRAPMLSNSFMIVVVDR